MTREGKTALRHLPITERPRERLLKYGVEQLSLAELMAILLATGTKGKSVLMLAQEILTRFEGLKGLLEASIPELIEIKGIGRAKAIQLKAAFGIALHATRLNSKPCCYVGTPQQAFEHIKEELAQQKQEVLMILLRDVRGNLIHQEKVAVGTLSEVLIHPREIFYPAVRHKAYSVIIAHNHPSGDPTPSKADIELTHLLLEASRVMGIGLEDHLIVGGNAFVSLRKQGKMGAVSSDLY